VRWPGFGPSSIQGGLWNGPALAGFVAVVCLTVCGCFGGLGRGTCLASNASNRTRSLSARSLRSSIFLISPIRNCLFVIASAFSGVYACRARPGKRQLPRAGTKFHARAPSETRRPPRASCGRQGLARARGGSTQPSTLRPAAYVLAQRAVPVVS
jgi:hypothetical protein